ncbi:MAG: ferritin [Gemmatimonadetes bacterium]|nr:ferritin [Gemmatimonadota bacterium]MBT8402317.1 ferritin [Gemmatimonadota bacterium]NNF39382.1 ferritin [Gemmatimonadota bacterium]NNK62448.1 ferritin [Gemmatimonadota bacterium]
MSPEILEALNDQIRMELSSGYVYLAMSAQFESESYDGFAHWMRLQAQEELEHAMKLFDYVNRRGGRVILQPIPGPPKEYGSPLDAFRNALEHEQAVTASIHRLFTLAVELDDVATQRELDWFVTEQVEEEENANRAVDLLARAGNDVTALLFLDKEFGSRTDEHDHGAE